MAKYFAGKCPIQSVCNCERVTSFSDSVSFALGQCSYQSPSATFPSPSALLICKNYAVPTNKQRGHHNRAGYNKWRKRFRHGQYHHTCLCQLTLFQNRHFSKWLLGDFCSPSAATGFHSLSASQNRYVMRRNLKKEIRSIFLPWFREYVQKDQWGKFAWSFTDTPAKKREICIPDWQNWSGRARNYVTGDMIDVTIMVMLLWSATRKFKAVHIFVAHSLYLNFFQLCLDVGQDVLHSDTEKFCLPTAFQSCLQIIS